MGDEHDGLDVETERAWRAFGTALGDHLAALDDGETWQVVVDPSVGTGLEPSASDLPTLQVIAIDDETVRGEVIPETYPMALFQDDRRVEQALLDLGWRDEGHGVFAVEVPRSQADRVAVLAVSTLGDVFGCLHPLFLVADPLDGWAPAPAPVLVPTLLDPAASVFPDDHDHLVALVDAALGPLLDDPVVRDEDGDVAISFGESVLFVRVRGDRPVVEVFAELVVDVRSPDLLPAELEILNKADGLARFHTRGDTAVMRYELIAWPFTATQLAVVIRELGDRLDETALDLARRVGGRRFLEAPRPELPPIREEVANREPVDRVALSMVLEMLHGGPLPVHVVADAFGRDRLVLIATIVAIRSESIDLDGHDPETVLDLLRLALRLVVDGRAEIAPAQRPRRHTSEQHALLDDSGLGEEPLDLDWSA